MDENTKRMMERLKADPAALRRLMQSRDGQTLMQTLTRPDNGAGLRAGGAGRHAGRHQRNGGAGRPGSPKPGGRGADGTHQPERRAVGKEVRPRGGV